MEVKEGVRLSATKSPKRSQDNCCGVGWFARRTRGHCLYLFCVHKLPSFKFVGCWYELGVSELTKGQGRDSQDGLQLEWRSHYVATYSHHEEGEPKKDGRKDDKIVILFSFPALPPIAIWYYYIYLPSVTALSCPVPSLSATSINSLTLSSVVVVRRVLPGYFIQMNCNSKGLSNINQRNDGGDTDLQSFPVFIACLLQQVSR